MTGTPNSRCIVSKKPVLRRAAQDENFGAVLFDCLASLGQQTIAGAVVVNLKVMYSEVERPHRNHTMTVTIMDDVFAHLRNPLTATHKDRKGVA